MLAKRVATVLPLVALLCATALVIVLARQLDATRQQRDLLAQRSQSLQPGAYVPLHTAPTLGCVNLRGAGVTSREEDRRDRLE